MPQGWTRGAVRRDGACEVLGLDPLYVACEGRMAVFVAAEDTKRAIEALTSVSSGARFIVKCTRVPLAKSLCEHELAYHGYWTCSRVSSYRESA